VLKTIIVLIRNNFETMIVNFYHTYRLWII
jgi:hypothetical protein